ncbi:polysaccharide deacetylase family protein [Nitrospinae bacterium AH_259_B05_G02_I21]|nr:polysaccharide deacetylase family protein [Nitrospinae bacterium AH_259_B05_G02_I21]MDA2932387.1 polysaccharide deacetylase family protein [Nitrospinae bacterium AH-259-F20]
MREIPILQFHSVSDGSEGPEDRRLSAAFFAERMAWLAENNYRVVSLDEAVAYMRGETSLEEPCVALTFDGAFPSAVTTVLPVLARHGYPAAFFVPVSCVGGMGRLDGKDYPCMKWDDVKHLAAEGMTVGAWGLTGPKFKGLEPERARREIEEAKSRLEEALGQPVAYFAVTEGVPNRQEKAWLGRAEWQACFTQCPTYCRSSLWNIGRIQIDDDDPNIFAFKCSQTYLFFKDKQLWRVIRKCKLDRIAHRVSKAVEARRVRRY